MTSAISTAAVDRFNLGRVIMLGKYYSSPIKKQLLLYSGITVLLYIMTVIPFKIPLFSFPAMLAIELMFYLSPIPFARDGGAVIDTMLPARVSEKYLFYLFHCLVSVPVVLAGSWMLLYLLSFWWLDSAQPIWELFQFNSDTFVFDGTYSPLIVLSKILDNLVPLCTAMAVIVTARRSPVAKCFLGIFLSFISLLIAGIIIGISVVFTNWDKISTISNLENYDDNSIIQIISHPLTIMGVIFIIVMAIYIIGCMYYTYRVMARRQF